MTKAKTQRKNLFEEEERSMPAKTLISLSLVAVSVVKRNTAFHHWQDSVSLAVILLA